VVVPSDEPGILYVVEDIKPADINAFLYLIVTEGLVATALAVPNEPDPSAVPLGSFQVCHSFAHALSPTVTDKSSAKTELVDDSNANSTATFLLPFI
jgi:hypothetical protein